MTIHRYSHREIQALKHHVIPMLQRVQLSHDNAESTIPASYQKLDILLAQEKITPEEHRLMILHGALLDTG